MGANNDVLLLTWLVLSKEDLNSPEEYKDIESCRLRRHQMS